MPDATPQQRSSPIEYVDVDRLELDPRNPRLTDVEVNASQVEILRQLYRRYDISDLLESLARNGYFDEEPLIAAPTGRKTASGQDILVVVEGNRRLAALKLLLSDDLRKAVSAQNVPTVDDAVVNTLVQVPVRIYDTRDEVIPYLGVRHIAGIKPWEALAKASYIYNLVQSGITLREVARTVGMKRTDLVRRWLLTLYVLKQANALADQPWDQADKDFNFSFLYTALGYANVRTALSIDTIAANDPQLDPVPPDKQPELLNVMSDLYGPPPGNSAKAKVTDSRQLRELAQVYGSREAIDELRSGVSLTVAHRKVGGESRELESLLRDADRNLSAANGLAPHHRHEEQAMMFARRCLESAQVLVGTLEGDH